MSLNQTSAVEAKEREENLSFLSHNLSTKSRDRFMWHSIVTKNGLNCNFEACISSDSNRPFVFVLLSYLGQLFQAVVEPFGSHWPAYAMYP